jgi:hypothetical protein
MFLFEDLLKRWPGQVSADIEHGVGIFLGGEVVLTFNVDPSRPRLNGRILILHYLNIYNFIIHNCVNKQSN